MDLFFIFNLLKWVRVEPMRGSEQAMTLLNNDKSQ